MVVDMTVRGSVIHSERTLGRDNPWAEAVAANPTTENNCEERIVGIFELEQCDYGIAASLDDDGETFL